METTCKLFRQRNDKKDFCFRTVISETACMSVCNGGGKQNEKYKKIH